MVGKSLNIQLFPVEHRRASSTAGSAARAVDAKAFETFAARPTFRVLVQKDELSRPWARLCQEDKPMDTSLGCAQQRPSRVCRLVTPQVLVGEIGNAYDTTVPMN